MIQTPSDYTTFAGTSALISHVILHQITFFKRKYPVCRNSSLFLFLCKWYDNKMPYHLSMRGGRQKSNAISGGIWFWHVGSKSELFTGIRHLFPILITPIGLQNGAGGGTVSLSCIFYMWTYLHTICSACYPWDFLKSRVHIAYGLWYYLLDIIYS